jgi:hypothetical protein
VRRALRARADTTDCPSPFRFLLSARIACSSSTTTGRQLVRLGLWPSLFLSCLLTWTLLCRAPGEVPFFRDALAARKAAPGPDEAAAKKAKEEEAAVKAAQEAAARKKAEEEAARVEAERKAREEAERKAKGEVERESKEEV